ncbi:MAG TPA: DeoR/GlpR family DNA-binding transcription regulator [Spirochaetia bacterium]|nr:DeoR/GlpR family DNA-binding transcription regulator [Spirochaetia bacterium]
MGSGAEEEKIFVEERRNRILDLLSRKNKASVAELSQEFRIGEATIRKDLNDLEQRGLILRTHGGALIMDTASKEAPLMERETRNREQKERIAQFIAQFIRNGESIMMDGGTTTLQIGRSLRARRNLVVVTNSPPLAAEMVNFVDTRVILTGGELRESTGALVGPLTTYSIRQFRVDRVILGMSSLVPDQGLFTANASEAEVKRVMMECGKEVIVAMDSGKIGKLTLSFVSDFSMVGKLVTDTGISAEDLEKIERKGVEVLAV